MNTDNDKGKKMPSNANSGKLDIQSNNQEPVLKSLSKLAQPFDEVGGEGILTADDVNTNLYSLRTELMAEIASRFL